MRRLRKEPPFTKALGISLLCHLLALVLFFTATERWQQLPERLIYSVTFQGGPARGGVQQLPEQTEDPPSQPVKDPVALPTPKAVPPPEPKADNLVIAEVIRPTPQPTKKVTPKPTPKATPRSTPKPTPKLTPEPTVAPTARPTPKATPAPTAKATPKPTARATVAPTAKATPVSSPAPTKEPDLDQSYQEALQRYLNESTNAGAQGVGGLGTAGQGRGGGLQRSPEWFLYKDQLESYIKRGWSWHDRGAKLAAVVTFRLSPEGILSDVRLVVSSGNLLYDDSVMRAVRKASPVPPPSGHLYKDFSFVEMEFLPE